MANLTSKKCPYGGMASKTIWKANCPTAVITETVIIIFKKIPVFPCNVVDVGVGTHGRSKKKIK